MMGTLVSIIIIFAQNMSKKCDRHLFSLKPNSHDTLHPQYFKSSFCGKTKTGCSRTPETNAACLNYPTFNTDRNYATPTFILGLEQGKEEEEGKRMCELHQRRMINYTDQKSSLNVPKPRSKNSFCSVCQVNFEDYLEHIKSKHHKNRIDSSQFNRHIIELTEKFASVQKEVKKYREPADDDSVEIISNPQKKIKPNQSGQYTGVPALHSWDRNRTSPSLPHQPVPLFPETNHYNFNINMNVFLENLPHPSFPYLPACQMNSYHPYQPWRVGGTELWNPGMSQLSVQNSQRLEEREGMRVAEQVPKHIQIIVIDE